MASGSHSAVLDPQVRQLSAAGHIGVLENVERLLDAAGAEVECVHELAAGFLEPAGELFDPHLVGLRRVPSQVEAGWPVLSGTDRVLPAEAGDEVAAWVADRRHPSSRTSSSTSVRKPSLSESGWLARRSRRRHSDRGARRRNRKPAIHSPDGEVRVDGQLSLRHGSLLIRRNERKGLFEGA
jgi:hypothetical protein